MRIDEVVVPERVLNVYRQWIDLVEDGQVLAHARAHKEIAAGFRVTEGNVAPLRDAIRRLLNRDDPPDWVLELLREAGLYQGFTVVLSGLAIRAGFDEWAAFLGEPSFIGAALLDPREVVRKHALEHVAEHPTRDPFENATRAQTLESLREQFRWFLEIAAPLHTEGQPGSGERDGDGDESPSTPGGTSSALESAEADRLTRKLDAAEERLRQAVVKHRERVKEARQHHARSLQEVETVWRGRAAALSRDRDALRIEAYSHADALARLTNDFEHHVEEAVAARFGELSLRWLARPLACEAAADALSIRLREGDDPVETAVRMLELQAQADTPFAARQQLKDRLAALRTVLGRVSEARSHALQPLPAFAEVVRALEAEVAECLSALGEPLEVASPLAARLQQALNTAPDLDAVAKVAQALALLIDHDLLSPAEHGELLVAQHARRTYLYDQAGALDKDAALVPLAGVETLMDALHAQLKGADPLAVLIDGHNLLLCVPRFRAFFDGDRAGAAYDYLADLLRTSLAHPGPHREIRVVLDGSVASAEHLSPGVQFLFSGGEGAGRADRMIAEEQLPALLHAAEAAAIWVISADRAVVREAQDAGVKTLHPRLFDLLLG